MSRQINQPSNQIKLTNVSIVRLRKAKKRFEIACYKNKVLEFRQGLETDIDSVLQISQVFLNVSKGQTAPKSDLDKAFGKGTGMDKICDEILRKGEIQVGEGERKEQMERTKMEVVSIVASKLVDPRTKVVYAPQVIEQALDLLMKEGGKGKVPPKEEGDGGASISSAGAGPTAGVTGTGKRGKGRGKGKKGKGKKGHLDDDVFDVHAHDHEDDGDGDGDDDKAEAEKEKEKEKEREKEKKPTTTKEATEKMEKLKLGEQDQEQENLEESEQQPDQPDQQQRIPTWTGVSSNSNKSAKAQALDAIRALLAHQEILPVMRARLKVQINAPSSAVTKQATKEKITKLVEEKVSEDFDVNGGGEWEMVAFVDPGAHRQLEEILGGKEFRGRGRVLLLGEVEEVED
ncbi:hypothetical protein MKZ38_003721 [Zalerion maritima]|uniref:Uncharacterized protein n=1 Tax=Zalerion maritima TaxID=339359 RepID=A0AAD5WV59_9PEZI|nr:hypothetical protein MKZ38_003721 [Zalerion maritima]